jgi:hypothetical protein
MLFVPRRAKPLFKLTTVVVSIVAFVLSIQIFRLEKATYNWPILAW